MHLYKYTHIYMCIYIRIYICTSLVLETEVAVHRAICIVNMNTLDDTSYM